MKILVNIGLVVVLLFVLLVRPVQAQEFKDIFKAPQEDITNYLHDYIEPGMLSFANGMAGGWYNTAATHKTLGFDLTFSVNVANIPQDEWLFAFNAANYTALSLQSGASNANLPTLVGGEIDQDIGITAGTSFTAPDGTEFEYSETISFQAPPGFDVSALPIAGAPTPTIQLGIGLFKNTDLKIRYGYMPEGIVKNFKFNVLGFGIMHDFKQWIPGIKHIPIDMSLFFGWSSFTAVYEVNVDEGDFIADAETELKASNTTMQIVVSKKLSIFTPYIGIGYNAVNSGVKVSGDFVVSGLEDPITGIAIPYTFSDPVDFEYGGGSSFRTTIGFRLKLAFLTLNTDYTFQKYNMLTVGMGISIR